MIWMAFPWFIQFSVLDVLDVLLVAFLIYQIYSLIKGTAAINIFFGIISIYILYLLVDALKMRLLSQILGQFIGVGVLALIIVFQQEIRRFLLYVGTTGLSNRWKLFRRFFPGTIRTQKLTLNITEVESALKELSANTTGALLVFLKDSELRLYQRSGIAIDAKLSAQLIQQLFFKNSPLHDGAVMVKGNILLTARCILPLTEKTDFPENLGLRHRAALGVTEMSDAIAVVVSEQTGQLSIAHKGELFYNITLPDLLEKLELFLRAE